MFPVVYFGMNTDDTYLYPTSQSLFREFYLQAKLFNSLQQCVLYTQLTLFFLCTLFYGSFSCIASEPILKVYNVQYVHLAID